MRPPQRIQYCRQTCVIQHGVGCYCVVQRVILVVSRSILYLDFAIRHGFIGIIAGSLVVLGLRRVQLLLQALQLGLQRFPALCLLQQLQLALGGLQILHLTVVVHACPLDLRLRQRGIVAHQRRALFHLVPLLDPDLLHRLRGGDRDFLYLVRGHRAAGGGAVAPVARHGEVRNGVHIHAAALGVPRYRQSAPHRAAACRNAQRDQYRLFHALAPRQLLQKGQFLTHSRHLPTARRPVWSSPWPRGWRWSGRG